MRIARCIVPVRPAPATMAAGGHRFAAAVNDLGAWVSRLHAQQVDTEAIRVDEYTQRRFPFFTHRDGLPSERYEERAVEGKIPNTLAAVPARGHLCYACIPYFRKYSPAAVRFALVA